MGIQEDRDEFNTTGLRGVLGRAMATTDEAFIKITQGGHQGELVSERPPAGSGSFLHYRRGEAVYEYRNASAGDDSRQVFRAQV